MCLLNTSVRGKLWPSHGEKYLPKSPWLIVSKVLFCKSKRVSFSSFLDHFQVDIQSRYSLVVAEMVVAV